MSQGNLSRLLKIIIIIMGMIGLVFYCYIVPMWSRDMAAGELARWSLPWLVFISLTAGPIYAGLVLFWKICTDIQRDRSFTHKRRENEGNIHTCRIRRGVSFYGQRNSDGA